MTIMAFTEHLLNLAAVVYRPEDDVDTLLADFALDLVRAGRRIGGIVQRNGKGDCGPLEAMQLIDLMTGRAMSICQALGPESRGCKLDPAALADAGLAVSRAVTADVDLVVINKFSKREVAGSGLRAEIADAVVAGLPVLTAVPDQFLDAWTGFTGGFGTTLYCDRLVIEDWWRETDRRASCWRAEADLMALAD